MLMIGPVLKPQENLASASWSWKKINLLGLKVQNL